MKLKKRKRSKNGTVLYVNGKMVHVRCLSIAQRTSCEMNININIFELKIQIQKYDFRTTENPNKYNSNIVVGCVITNR